MTEKKSEILSTTAEINTGKTAVELKGDLVKDLPVMSDKELDFAKASVLKYVLNNHVRSMMIMSKELSYFTLFNNKSELGYEEFVDEIFKFIMEDTYLAALGGLKLVDVNESHIEVWIGGHFFAMFDFEPLTVEV